MHGVLHAGHLGPEDLWEPSEDYLLSLKTLPKERHPLVLPSLRATAYQTVYDSISPSAMPNDGNPVCVYADGLFATTSAAVARFKGPVAWITVFANHGLGIADDCEQGNTGPSAMPAWAQARRAAGYDPTVYCGMSQWWSQIISAFESAGVTQPHYWVANYTYNPSTPIPAGAIGIQYSDKGGGGGYDVSTFVNPWPGVQSGPSPSPTPAPPPPPPVQEPPMTPLSTPRPDGNTDFYTLVPNGQGQYTLVHVVQASDGTVQKVDEPGGKWLAPLGCGYRGQVAYFRGIGADLHAWEVAYDPAHASSGWLVYQLDK